MKHNRNYEPAGSFNDFVMEEMEKFMLQKQPEYNPRQGQDITKFLHDKLRYIVYLQQTDKQPDTQCSIENIHSYSSRSCAYNAKEDTFDCPAIKSNYTATICINNQKVGTIDFVMCPSGHPMEVTTKVVE